jgi:putative membrane protein
MRKYMLACVGVAVFALAFAAPAAAQTTPSSPATDANGGDTRANAAQTSNDGSAFLRVAGQDGRAEVALAELAATKAESADVKAYADRLHRDHEKANAELETIAQQMDVTVSDPSTAQQDVKRRLQGLSGVAFDRAYIQQMVEDHQKAIAAFTTASKEAEGSVKDFAARTLPTLQDHLSRAQALERQLGSERRRVSCPWIRVRARIS